MTSFVSFFGIFLLMSTHWAPSGWKSENNYIEVLSIIDLWEAASPPVISHTVTLVLLPQMWTSVPPTPTVVSPESTVWTQWVHLYVSTMSLVLQATTWGTVFARVSSLFLKHFIKPIYSAAISRAHKVVTGNADDVALCSTESKTTALLQHNNFNFGQFCKLNSIYLQPTCSTNKQICNLHSCPSLLRFS